MGLAQAIDLDVVGAGAGPARRDPAGDLSRQRQGRRTRRPRRGRRGAARRDGLRAVAGAAAQSRKGIQGQGHRPHRPDPGNLRPPRAHRRGRAAGRTRPSRLSEVAAGALLDPPGAPARRLRLPRRPRRNPDRDRPAPDPGADHPPRARPRAGQEDARAASRQPAATFPIRSSRWSATPTPASRRCSIG